MTAQESRDKALKTQRNRWSKLSLEIRTAIQESVECGQLHCIINTKLDNMEIHNLKALGYNVKNVTNIIDDVFEISW
jgi:hypothetical protein